MTYKWRLFEEGETLDIFVDLDENVTQRWTFNVYFGVGMLAFVVDDASFDQDGLLLVELLIWFAGLD